MIVWRNEFEGVNYFRHSTLRTGKNPSTSINFIFSPHWKQVDSGKMNLVASERVSIIKPGSTLCATEFGNNSSWVSPSGHFAFGFYPQGNGFAVGIWLLGGDIPPQKTVVWTSNRDSSPLPSNSTLNITTTGLRLFPSGRESLALISTVNTTSASMLDSGNFVLYSDGSTVVWQSFDHPTDTLLGGQNLTVDAKLVSSVSEKDYSSGAFIMVMQSDGNLVAYPKNSAASGTDAYWASNTFVVSELGLDATGSLCIGISCLNENISPGNKSHNTSSIYRATLVADGNFILYEHQFENSSGSTNVRVLWNTSIGKCQIKGFCGFNSYCSNATGDAVCECFPGFVPSNSSGNASQNCILAYALDGCRSSEAPNQMILYNITQLEHVYWVDTPFSVVPMKEKECEKSLLDDCDCVAVLYSNGNCEKYGLPLIYGRWLQNLSVVALFKNASTIQNPIPSNFFPKPKSKVVTDNKNSLIMILAFTLGSISFLSLIFAVFIFFIYKRKVRKYTTLSASENLGFTGECSLRSFSFDELVKSTENFTEEIGRGSFGVVYRGETSDENQKQGGDFVVAIWLVSGENKTVVWTAQRNDPPVTSGAKLQLNMDGKLVLTDDQREEKNDHSSGRFRLKMQDDGNLVLYPVDTTDAGTEAYWASNTRSALNRVEEYQNPLDKNGTLRILNESSDGRTKVILSVISNSSLANDGNRIIYRATLNYDGIFRLYAHFKNGSTQILEKWPDVKNMCSIKGFCGFNSYCTLDDAQPLCSCLSGFISIHPNDSTLGCKRSFLKEDCWGKKDSATSYEMKSEENIVWVDFPYFKAEISQEECSAACLADCNCEAAFYDGVSCMKQRLPLRYLRRQLSDYRTSVLLWKVGDSLSNRTENDYPVPVPEPPPIKATSNKATVHIIVITSVFSLLLCSTIVISSHYTYKIRILKYKRLMETGNLGLNEEVTLRRFSYSELKRATNNFKIELGKGSFGAVYKGALDKGKLNKLFPWEVVDDKTAVENMIKVALWCIQDEPFLRPTMKSVVLMLEGVTDIAIPPCPASNST
ncbi:G-type lectin S-receptor-like serine/threonine-protein [Vigna angularis]|uniref:G-type lectin S-receptor-like serine/threonine-protein n=1 Tax=Phaseolus angularis TaxID=3914 RepID=A0A8T0L7M1_PHAAN|nr:G-type lectin S-receptor-like serine/threonine-protein [Vigna angularis]